jgi:hypothetical protein
MMILVKVNDRIVIARIIEGPTGRDSIARLPLTLTMNDLFKRQKFGHRPRAISNDGKLIHSTSLAISGAPS